MKQALWRLLISVTSERTARAGLELLRSLRGDVARWRTRFAAPPTRSVPFKLNIGCGPNHKDAEDGWVNLDIAPGADLRIDVRDGLPLPDASCEVVYSEHFLEHLAYPDESGPFLAECFRVLGPGGVLHVGVPDARSVVESCLGEEIDPEFLRKADELGWSYPASCETGFEFINHHFRLGGQHRFAFDQKTLCVQIERAGFSVARRRSFDAALDTKRREEGSLYVVARKEDLSLY